MAKKKAVKKAAPKAKTSAKVVPIKKAAKTAKAAKPRPASPRSQVLPGMEQVRNRSLDRICEEMSDVRASINDGRTSEKELMNQAVPIMIRDKVSAYRFSGIELVMVPGDVHLRVRVLKDKANSDAPAKDESGSGQDAGEIADALTEDDAVDTGDTGLEG